MTNYTFVNYKNTKSLIPKEVWLTAEHRIVFEKSVIDRHHLPKRPVPSGP